MSIFANKSIISKQELRNYLDVSRSTFQRWLIEISKNDSCPFKLQEIKKGHFIKIKHVNYILDNI